LAVSYSIVICRFARSLSAVRLLILGRCGRDVARELGVNEHTITRWRRLPAFGEELRRQQELLYVELRQREVRRVADHHATVDAIARRYGVIR
jgi:transposase-like protein